MSDKPYMLMVEIEGKYYVTREDAEALVNENAALKLELKSLGLRASNYIKAIRAERGSYLLDGRR